MENQEFDYSQFEDSGIESAKTTIGDLQKKIQELNELKSLREQELKQRRAVAHLEKQLKETETELQRDIANPLRVDAKQLDLSQIKVDSLSELRDAIRKHAVEQLEANGNATDGMVKMYLENYTRDMAAFVHAAKQDKKSVGEKYPYADERDLAERAEYYLRIKPFVKLRIQ